MILMVVRVTALREVFLAKGGNHHCEELESGTSIQAIRLPTSEMQDTQTKVQAPADVEGTVDCDRLKDDAEKDRSSTAAGLMDLNDASDEFFDVLEPSDFNDLECEWPSDDDEESLATVLDSCKICFIDGFYVLPELHCLPLCQLNSHIGFANDIYKSFTDMLLLQSLAVIFR